MILDHQKAKSGMPASGIKTRNGLKKLSSGSRGSSLEDHNQHLNETVKNSVDAASAKSSKQSHKGEQTAEVVKVDSARSSKKRKIEEISNDDTNA
jgi:hypothetical protein